MQLFTQTALVNAFFGAVKLTENTDPDNYTYCGYGIVFDARERFLLSVGSLFSIKMIIFGTDMTSLVHMGNKRKMS